MTRRWQCVSPGTRRFVATQEMHAAGTPHRVLSAGSMQLKHSGNTPGPSGCVCAASRESTINKPFLVVSSQLQLESAPYAFVQAVVTISHSYQIHPSVQV